VRDGTQTPATQLSRMIECTEEAPLTMDTLFSPPCFRLKRAKVLASAIPSAPLRLRVVKKVKFKISFITYKTTRQTWANPTSLSAWMLRPILKTQSLSLTVFAAFLTLTLLQRLAQTIATLDLEGVLFPILSKYSQMYSREFRTSKRRI